MSEPKGPFDDAIRILHEAKGEAILVDEELVEVQLDAAIRVLEDWPKWEPLIEAAGKIDKNKALSRIGEVYDYQIALGVVRDEVWGEIRALLEALPDKEE